MSEGRASGDRGAPVVGDARAAIEDGFGALVHRIGVIWRLEAVQMLRPGAVLWAVVLASIPAVLLLAVRSLDALDDSQEQLFEIAGAADVALYVLIPGVVCFLGLLLTATSAIQSELENRTWIYLAVRPRAKLATLLGKYLFAVSWVMAIVIGATVAAAAALAGLVTPGMAARTVGLSLLACLAYGALYLFIGVAFVRVGMVIAIAYTLIVEILLGAVPAVVNEATVAYHLRSLFVRGLPDGTLPAEVTRALGETSGPAVTHVAVILAMASLFLGAAIGMLRLRQAAALDPE